MKKLKWVHFYKTDYGFVDTLHLDSMHLQIAAQETPYHNKEEMIAGNTDETFNFWDGVPVGVGQSKD